MDHALYNQLIKPMSLQERADLDRQLQQERRTQHENTLTQKIEETGKEDNSKVQTTNTQPTVYSKGGCLYKRGKL